MTRQVLLTGQVAFAEAVKKAASGLQASGSSGHNHPDG